VRKTAIGRERTRDHRWKRTLEDGQYTGVSEIAAAEKIDRGYVGSILRLTLLAPDIVEEIMDGRQPAGLALPRLIERFSLYWAGQRTTLLDDVPLKTERAYHGW
jgi:hypothetical protein